MLYKIISTNQDKKTSSNTTFNTSQSAFDIQQHQKYRKRFPGTSIDPVTGRTIISY